MFVFYRKITSCIFKLATQDRKNEHKKTFLGYTLNTSIDKGVLEMQLHHNTSSTLRGKHLTQHDRQLIELWKNKHKLSNREIARRLDKSPQTIHNEIKRGTVDLTFTLGTYEYSAIVAQENYDLMRSVVGRTDIWTPEKANAIKAYMQQKFSPQVISQMENMPSCSTIYQWIHKGWIKGITRADMIYPRKEKPIKKQTNSSPRKPDALSIEERPETINNREEDGHFEIDLIILNRNKGIQLLTLTDRKTRFTLIRIVLGKSIEAINSVMAKLKSIYHIKSITADNGSEFLGLDQVLDCPIYDAHPYASYERGPMKMPIG